MLYFGWILRVTEGLPCQTVLCEILPCQTQQPSGRVAQSNTI